ncbi:FAD binding domain-containing protein [Salibacterium qingdaonense]|uniref:Carbon-monoxide dehydrogenase medium subunit n=1 Tax=Salibacterium qingdaonense TaxID=266892 RepID=A0A1I4HXA6_9BACI|nr:FAD binding domain-containing protein [Salibacterium qingdaonense]SFL46383.1 carbon-monoxide dehydrogenase medium subunit [Salibacterium qingdaonense]
MAVERYAGSVSHVDTPLIRFPRTLEEAWEKKQENGADASYIAGGTVIQMQRGQGYPCSPVLISLETIEGLKGITIHGDYLEIGPLTTLEACRRSPLLQQHAPCLVEALISVAAPGVRNRGTIGGNIMYGKGDTLPALLVLDASVSFFDNSGFQSLPLLSFVNKGETSPDLLSGIKIPLPTDTERTISFFKKTGRREAFSLSVINAACRLVLDEEKKVEEVRLAAGGANVPPQCLTEAENTLRGEMLSTKTLRNLHETLSASFHPSGDSYCSGRYKQKAAAHLILSHLYENMEQSPMERRGEDA